MIEPYTHPFEGRQDTVAKAFWQAFDDKEKGRVGRARRGFKRLCRQYRSPLSLSMVELAELIEVMRQEAVCCRKLGMSRLTHWLFHECHQYAVDIHPDLALAVWLDWSAARLDRGEAPEVEAEFRPVYEDLPESHPMYARVEGYFGRVCIRTGDPSLQAEGLDLIPDAVVRLQCNPDFKPLCFDFEAWMLEALVWPGEDGARRRQEHFERIYPLAKQISSIRAAEVYLRYKTGDRWLPLAGRLNGVMCRLPGLLPL